LANPLVAPTAGGGLLNLAPHETAVERAVELAQRLGVVEAEKQALAIHVRQLEAALEARDRMLAESAREVEQATAEMTATRNDLRALRKELAAVSGQMRQSEKADLDSMKAILASLEKLLDPNPVKVPGP
jgi:septal ring factor EnvC (AmiA/AmiB activator)